MEKIWKTKNRSTHVWKLIYGNIRRAAFPFFFFLNSAGTIGYSFGGRIKIDHLPLTVHKNN